MMRESVARQRGYLKNSKQKRGGETEGERKKREMAIERCDKCGKAFMSKSEAERHKMYEHPIPVSPFEERRLDTDLGENNSNNDITTIGGGGQIRKVPFRAFRV